MFVVGWAMKSNLGGFWKGTGYIGSDLFPEAWTTAIAHAKEYATVEDAEAAAFEYATKNPELIGKMKVMHKRYGADNKPFSKDL